MTSRRLLTLLLAIGLLASLYVAIRRERHEHAARTVEIVMDDSDFAALARSYNYDQACVPDRAPARRPHLARRE